MTDVLLIEKATSDDGTFIGYRLFTSGDPEPLLVFADQNGMPGFRIGNGFIPKFDENITYTNYMASSND